MARQLRIGTRGSELALWQARHIAGRLGGDVEIQIIKTAGDQIQHLSLDKVEGKGFFTKEIEAALLAKQVDIAVHSYKDLPIEQPPGLCVVGVPVRAPVRDVLVRRRDQSSSERWGLPKGARVGTSSLRRKAQFLALRPDVQLHDLRGNVPTRFKKVSNRELDAVLLAEAGLFRLGVYEQAADYGLELLAIEPHELCPAPAQGALAIQTRADDDEAKARVLTLHDPATAAAVDLERKLLGRFGGGCHLPLGALGTVPSPGTFDLMAVVASPSGDTVLRAKAQGPVAAKVVEEVYQKLVAQGAERYL